MYTTIYRKGSDKFYKRSNEGNPEVTKSLAFLSQWWNDII